MSRLTYAEKFGVEPQRVNPPLRWWYRWQAWSAAQASAQAWERARNSSNWAKDLTPEDIQAMKWAE